jgi:RNA polymerase sigma-70 factor (ECF subfamily)
MTKEKTAEAQKLREFEEQALPLMPLMYGMARKICRDGFESYAEDLVDETYVKAFKSWHTFEQGTKLSAWMIRIMKNTLTNHKIKESRSKSFTSYDDMEEWQRDRNPESLTSRTNLSAEAEAIASMPSKVIDAALSKLPPLRREIIDHVIIQGYSYAETAQELGIPTGTVMSNLHRGKNQLRELLTEYAAQEGYDTTAKQNSEGM